MSTNVPTTVWNPTPNGEMGNANLGVERITQDSSTRITEDGSTRVLEDASYTPTPQTVWGEDDSV